MGRYAAHFAKRMHRFRESEAVDYASSAWGRRAECLLQRLGEAGFRVIGFDAGPFWDTERDWVSDEAGSHKLYWNDLRITGGDRSARLRRKQQRQRRRRRLGSLGRLHAALPSLRLPRLYAKTGWAPTGQSRTRI